MYKFISEHIPFVTDKEKRAEISKGIDGLAGMLQIIADMSTKKIPQEVTQ